MAEKMEYQDLTLWDRTSVLLYRGGLIVSSLVLTIGGAAFTVFHRGTWSEVEVGGPVASGLIVLLYLAAGLSTATIHLYAKRFRKMIRYLYLFSVVTFLFGLPVRQDIAGFILKEPVGALFLLPLMGCLSFFTLKEAFCFRLYEGYILSLMFPLIPLMLMTKVTSPALTGVYIFFVGLTMLYFNWRKVRIPIAYDIGDKSAYEH